MAELSIRPCTFDDLGAVIPLLEQLWPGVTMDRERLVPVFRKGLESSDQYYFCGEAQGDLIAFCAMTLKNSIKREGPLTLIDELVVDSRARGLGLGEIMLNHAIEWARDRGCTVIELESGNQREAAHRFYLNRGFDQTALFFSRRID